MVYILKFDYLKELEIQCDIIIQSRNLKESADVFSSVCRNLSRDFLPPIAREDIAAISYSLVDIAAKSKDILLADEIKKQINSLEPVLNSLFSKNKTCGEEIRRLIETNIKFKSNDVKLSLLNDSLKGFFKTVLLAYYGNL